jgi:hypothetical protein
MNETKINEQPFDKENGQQIRWLRPKTASTYFNMSRSTIDRLAVACDAKKKIASRTVLYDIEKLNAYLESI